MLSGIALLTSICLYIAGIYAIWYCSTNIYLALYYKHICCLVLLYQHLSVYILHLKGFKYPSSNKPFPPLPLPRLTELELTRVNPDRNIFSINVELTSTFLLYRGLVHHHHWILKHLSVYLLQANMLSGIALLTSFCLYIAGIYVVWYCSTNIYLSIYYRHICCLVLLY